MDEVAREIYLKYKYALIAIGVDLENYDVVNCIENCNYDLETRFQAIIAYWYWLKANNRSRINPDQILINAFYQEWKPINWKDEYLDNERFKSPAQKWWDKARKVDILNSLIIDVIDNFWSGGKIVFKDPNGSTDISRIRAKLGWRVLPWTMDLERAIDMSWHDILEHYQRVTGIIIESHPGRFVYLDTATHKLREESELS